MEKNEFRAYIKTRVILGKNATAIWEELQIAYPGQAPQYSCVAKWVKLFKEGRESVQDNPRPGRPITTLTAQNIELVRQIIEIDPRSTIDIIEAQTGINHFTIHQILHHALKLRKLISRWIPYELTDANRKERVDACRENLAMFNEGKWRLCDMVTADESWIYWRQIGRKSYNACWVGEGEHPAVTVRRSQFEPKSMFFISFKTTGPVNLHCLIKEEKVSAAYYVKHCLKPMFKLIKDK